MSEATPPAGLFRRLAWAPRLAWALGFGSLVRQLRRLVGRPPRVRHGTFPMHMLRTMVAVDRLAGFPSASIVGHSRLNRGFELVNAADFDVVMEARGLRWNEVHLALLAHLLRHADIFVFFFDTRFASATRPDLTVRALAWLKRSGVKLLALPSGLDVVYADGRTTRYGFVERVQADYPDWDLASDAADIRGAVEGICGVADFVISGDAVCSRFLVREDLRFKYFPTDVDRIETTTASHSPRTTVVHAPNHRAIKGTSCLLEASSRLRDAGLDFDLDLVERVPHREAMARYASADIIADQFSMGAFGVLALEGLALGKPVLAYLDEEHLGDPAFNLPIVNTNASNVERVLAVLLQLPALRERLGEAGRIAVERYQSPDAMAEVWAKIYRHLWRGDALQLERTEHFSPARKPRSFTEDPADEAFWPVPVDDLINDIRALVGSAACVA